MEEHRQIELVVAPSEGVTDAYAAASGDHNPIHLDEEFARSVGLQGRILHGLWTMAQVARAATAAAGAPTRGSGDDAAYSLASLSVQFRGMGKIGPAIEVTGTADDGSVTISVSQDGTRLIRNATATLR